MRVKLTLDYYDYEAQGNLTPVFEYLNTHKGWDYVVDKNIMNMTIELRFKKDEPSWYGVVEKDYVTMQLCKETQVLESIGHRAIDSQIHYSTNKYFAISEFNIKARTISECLISLENFVKSSGDHKEVIPEVVQETIKPRRRVILGADYE